jgi:hypothetical protein
MKCISNLSINTYKMPYLLDKNSNIWTFYVLTWNTRTFYVLINGKMNIKWTFYVLTWNTRTFYVLINGKMNIKWTFYVLTWNTRTFYVYSLNVLTFNVQDEKNVQTF